MNRVDPFIYQRAQFRLHNMDWVVLRVQLEQMGFGFRDDFTSGHINDRVLVERGVRMGLVIPWVNG